MAMLLENPNGSLLGTQPPALPEPSPSWLDPLLLCQNDKHSLLRTLRDQRTRTGVDLVRSPNRASRAQHTPKPHHSYKNYVSREKVSTERAKHLERNRLAANKCRLKKKEENERTRSILDYETGRREALLAEVTVLKEELWQLKNRIFAHVNCEDHSIQTQLTRMSQDVLEASPCAPKCPSPTFSASTRSSISLPSLDPGAPEYEINTVDDYCLGDLLDGCIDPTKL